MIRPELTPDEPGRLEALARTNLIDTGLEERFDRVTRLVKRMLDCRISVVSLVDADRQFFKSVEGLDSCGTDRDISFCGHAIHEGDFLIVRDAREDPRFADNPLVVGPPHVVSYVGAVLRSPEGFRLGSLCAIDTRPRTYCPADLRALRDLASIVEREIALSARGAESMLACEPLSAAARREHVDEVTRVWNREAILERAAREVEQARERGRGVGVLVVTLGGLEGFSSSSDRDGARRLAARRILGSVRSTDSVGCLDERSFLCVITPCTSARSAGAVMARICERIEGEALESGSGVVRLRAGVGIAVLDPSDPGAGVESMIERAREEARIDEGAERSDAA